MGGLWPAGVSLLHESWGSRISETYLTILIFAIIFHFNLSKQSILYSPAWPRTQSANQSDLELRDTIFSAFNMLVSNTCAPKLGSHSSLAVLSLQKHYLVMIPVVDAIWAMILHPNAQSPKPLCLFPDIGCLCHLSHQKARPACDYPMSEEELWHSLPLLNFIYFLMTASIWALCAYLSLYVHKSQEINPSSKTVTSPVCCQFLWKNQFIALCQELTTLLYLPLFSCLETTCLVLICSLLVTNHSFCDLSAKGRVLVELYLTLKPLTKTRGTCYLKSSCQGLCPGWGTENHMWNMIQTRNLRVSKSRTMVGQISCTIILFLCRLQTLKRPK